MATSISPTNILLQRSPSSKEQHQQGYSEIISSIAQLGQRNVREYRSEFILPNDVAVAVNRQEAYIPSLDSLNVSVSLATAAEWDQLNATNSTGQRDMLCIGNYVDQDPWARFILRCDASTEGNLMNIFTEEWSDDEHQTQTLDSLDVSLNASPLRKVEDSSKVKVKSESHFQEASAVRPSTLSSSECSTKSRFSYLDKLLSEKTSKKVDEADPVLIQPVNQIPQRSGKLSGTSSKSIPAIQIVHEKSSTSSHTHSIKESTMKPSNIPFVDEPAEPVSRIKPIGTEGSVPQSLKYYVPEVKVSPNSSNIKIESSPNNKEEDEQECEDEVSGSDEEVHIVCGIRARHNRPLSEDEWSKFQDYVDEKVAEHIPDLTSLSSNKNEVISIESKRFQRSQMCRREFIKEIRHSTEEKDRVIEDSHYHTSPVTSYKETKYTLKSNNIHSDAAASDSTDFLSKLIDKEKETQFSCFRENVTSAPSNKGTSSERVINIELPSQQQQSNKRTREIKIETSVTESPKSNDAKTSKPLNGVVIVRQCESQTSKESVTSKSVSLPVEFNKSKLPEESSKASLDMESILKLMEARALRSSNVISETSAPDAAKSSVLKTFGTDSRMEGFSSVSAPAPPYATVTSGSGILGIKPISPINAQQETKFVKSQHNATEIRPHVSMELRSKNQIRATVVDSDTSEDLQPKNVDNNVIPEGKLPPFSPPLKKKIAGMSIDLYIPSKDSTETSVSTKDATSILETHHVSSTTAQQYSKSETHKDGAVKPSTNDSVDHPSKPPIRATAIDSDTSEISQENDANCNALPEGKMPPFSPPCKKKTGGMSIDMYIPSQGQKDAPSISGMRSEISLTKPLEELEISTTKTTSLQRSTKSKSSKRQSFRQRSGSASSGDENLCDIKERENRRRGVLSPPVVGNKTSPPLNIEEEISVAQTSHATRSGRYTKKTNSVRSQESQRKLKPSAQPLLDVDSKENPKSTLRNVARTSKLESNTMTSVGEKRPDSHALSKRPVTDRNEVEVQLRKDRGRVRGNLHNKSMPTPRYTTAIDSEEIIDAHGKSPGAAITSTTSTTPARSNASRNAENELIERRSTVYPGMVRDRSREIDERCRRTAEEYNLAVAHKRKRTPTAKKTNPPVSGMEREHSVSSFISSSSEFEQYDEMIELQHSTKDKSASSHGKMDSSPTLSASNGVRPIHKPQRQHDQFNKDFHTDKLKYSTAAEISESYVGESSMTQEQRKLMTPPSIPAMATTAAVHYHDLSSTSASDNELNSEVPVVKESAPLPATDRVTSFSAAKSKDVRVVSSAAKQSGKDHVLELGQPRTISSSSETSQSYSSQAEEFGVSGAPHVTTPAVSAAAKPAQPNYFTDRTQSTLQMKGAPPLQVGANASGKTDDKPGYQSLPYAAAISQSSDRQQLSRDIRQEPSTERFEKEYVTSPRSSTKLFSQSPCEDASDVNTHPSHFPQNLQRTNSDDRETSTFSDSLAPALPKPDKPASHQRPLAADVDEETPDNMSTLKNVVVQWPMTTSQRDVGKRVSSPSANDNLAIDPDDMVIPTAVEKKQRRARDKNNKDKDVTEDILTATFGVKDRKNPHKDKASELQNYLNSADDFPTPVKDVQGKFGARQVSLEELLDAAKSSDEENEDSSETDTESSDYSHQETMIRVTLPPKIALNESKLSSVAPPVGANDSHLSSQEMANAAKSILNNKMHGPVIAGETNIDDLSAETGLDGHLLNEPKPNATLPSVEIRSRIPSQQREKMQHQKALERDENESKTNYEIESPGFKELPRSGKRDYPLLKSNQRPQSENVAPNLVSNVPMNGESITSPNLRKSLPPAIVMDHLPQQRNGMSRPYEKTNSLAAQSVENISSPTNADTIRIRHSYQRFVPLSVVPPVLMRPQYTAAPQPQSGTILSPPDASSLADTVPTSRTSLTPGGVLIPLAPRSSVGAASVTSGKSRRSAKYSSRPLVNTIHVPKRVKPGSGLHPSTNSDAQSDILSPKLSSKLQSTPDHGKSQDSDRESVVLRRKHPSGASSSPTGNSKPLAPQSLDLTQAAIDFAIRFPQKMREEQDAVREQEKLLTRASHADLSLPLSPMSLGAEMSHQLEQVEARRRKRLLESGVYIADDTDAETERSFAVSQGSRRLEGDPRNRIRVPVRNPDLWTGGPQSRMHFQMYEDCLLNKKYVQPIEAVTPVGPEHMFSPSMSVPRSRRRASSIGRLTKKLFSSSDTLNVDGGEVTLRSASMGVRSSSQDRLSGTMQALSRSKRSRSLPLLQTDRLSSLTRRSAGVSDYFDPPTVDPLINPRLCFETCV